MCIKYVDPNRFVEMVYKKGLSLNEASLKICGNRAYLSKSFTAGTVSPRRAKEICEVLDVNFDEVFKIE